MFAAGQNVHASSVVIFRVSYNVRSFFFHNFRDHSVRTMFVTVRTMVVLAHIVFVTLRSVRVTVRALLVTELSTSFSFVKCS